MTDQPQPRAGQARTLKMLIVLAAAGALAALLVLLLHTPVVRRAVLGYTLPRVERDFGIVVDATRLDYNLATMRIGLAGVRLAAPHAASEPFFTADYVSVVVPWRIAVGEVAFEEIGVSNARVFVRRRSDGTSNLPAASEAPAGDTPPLRLQRLDIPQLAVDIRDEQSVMTVWVPSAAILLTPSDGHIRLTRDAELRSETQITHLSHLNGAAAFDGRALHLDDLQVRSDELAARVEGSVTLIGREQAVDVRMRGTGDLAGLTRWVVTTGELPSGDVAFEAEVEGVFDNLQARVTATSPRLGWQDVVGTEVSVRAAIDAERADLEDLGATFAGGHISATAQLPFSPDGEARVHASWDAIDAASATRMASTGAAVVPSGTLSGELDARGTGWQADRWLAALRLTVAGGRNRTGQIAVPGVSTLQFDRGVWSINARHSIGGVAPVIAAIGGDASKEGRAAFGGDRSEDLSLQDIPVTGRIRVAETELTRMVAALRATGVADVQSDAVTAGILAADVDIAGRLGDPVLDGRATVQDLAVPQVELPAIQAQFRGRPLQPSMEFAADAAVATIAGEPVSTVRAVGRLVANTLTLDELSAQQPVTTGMLRGRGMYDLRSGRYDASVDGAGWRISATADQPIAGSIDLHFAGAGTIDEPGATGTIAVREALWAGRPLGDVGADVAVQAGEAFIEARAPEFAATAEARIGLEAPYPTVIDARAQGFDLGHLQQYVESPTPVGGTTTLAFHGEGPLSAWRTGSASLDVSSLEAEAGDLKLRLVDSARVRYEGERVHVERLELAAGDMHMSASGELPAFDASERAPGVLLTVTGDVDEVVRAANATGLRGLPITGGNGPVALLAHVTGALQDPLLAADLEVGPGSVALRDLPTVTGLRVRAHAENGWIELREGAASYEQAELSVTGKAPLSLFRPAGPLASGSAAASGPAILHVRATSLTPAVLAAFVEPSALDEISGSIDATLEASSSSLNLADVTGELRIDRLDVRLADLPVTQRVPTRIVARDGFARVEAWEWVGQGASLGVQGQVRLDDRQAAILANGVVDLRVLTPFIRDAGVSTAGRLEPRLSITGTLDDPRVDGDLLVSGGELRLLDPRVIVSDLAMRAVISRTTSRITTLNGSINGGALTGGGTFDYTDDGAVDARLTANVQGMALEFPEGLRSEVDAALGLTFNTGLQPEPGGLLSGTVTVVRGAYREPLAVVTGLLANLRAQRLAAGAADSSPVLDRLALDLRVVTDEDVFVNNNYGRFQLGADLRLIGTAAAPALSGRAELREGGQLFVGRNVYTLEFGTVDFTNPVAIEPVLNVAATTRAGGEDVEVTISGAAESPTVNLTSSSNPDLGYAELASLLLTGRLLEELAPGDAAFVGAQVIGNFSAEVLGFASRAVGLDTLRLGGVDNPALRRDPTAVATELDPTTRVTFGKSLGPDVDVTFSQSLRDSDAQTWIVDYLPARGLELRLVSNDDDLRSYGFRHDVALGSRPRSEPRAPARPMSPRVTAVDVAGDLRLAESRVRDTLRLRPGDEFDFGAWQDDRDRLEALYRSEGYLTGRITARRADADPGVALEYRIDAGPQTAIEVTGMDISAALRARLQTAWAQSVFDEFLVEEAAEIIRGELGSRGYLRPEVGVRLRDEGAARVLTIAVEPGSRTTRTSIRVDGAGELTDEITAYLAERALVEHAFADAALVEDEVTGFLRSRGRLRARATAGAPLFEEATAVLPLTIDAGPVFLVSRILFEGAEALPVSQLRDAAALEAGTPYDPGAVAGARERLLALLRREGFAAAAVAARPVVRTDVPEVEIAFAATPGPRHILQEVVVTGNRTIDADVVIRALDLTAGEPLKPEDLFRARARVFDTGLFRRIDVVSEAIEDGGGTAMTPMRLRVTVEEWPAVRLRYGLVLAEERPQDRIEGRELVPGLSADVTRRTLFGRAVGVGSALELQRREQRGRVFVNTPTFFGLPIGSSLIGERSREQFQAVSLVTSRSSVTWEQRARIAGSLGVSYAYTFERNHTVDTRPPDPFAPAFDITVNIARFNAAAAWDTRDDPTDTMRGLFASSTIEFAPEAVGSDIRFVRQLQQAYYFRPWRRMVFASAARVGVVAALGGQELIVSERFFAGGSRTVRGIAEEGLGGRDFFGDPTGGQALLVLNQEVRFPIYKWLRGVGFVDAGNVFTRPRDITFGDLVGSTGVGLRLATPFALLRVDYGKPMWGAPASSGRWTFGIGQAF